MAIDRDYLRTRFPGSFTTTADGVLDAAIAEAVRRVNTEAFGSRSDDAITYLAAHLAAVSAAASTSGISSATVGGVSVTYNRAGGVHTGFRDMFDELTAATVLGVMI